MSAAESAAEGAVESLSYVYAVALDDGRSAEVAALRGVGGAPIRWVAAAGLRAATGDVDRLEFTGGRIAEHLEDLTWLAATARAHHGVVDALGRVVPVAPLALATVYLGDDRVREVLVARRAGFVEVLDRLAGCAEFGLKVFLRPAGARDEPRASTGAGYLRARRQELHEADATRTWAREAAEELDLAVTMLAVDARSHRLQDAALSGTPAPMVLNRAHLVPIGREDDLADLVERFAEHHPRLRVELTGPWVPYSFAGEPDP